MNKITNQKAWLFVLPVLALVAFNAIILLMTVVNYSIQETFGSWGALATAVFYALCVFRWV